MKNTQGIEGAPDPRQSRSAGQDNDIDPEKFKKVLKVDESDEAEKRRNRNLTKGELEGDDVEESEEITTPQTLFSDLMEDPGETSSVFDSQEGSKSEISSARSDQGQTPYNMISEERQPDPNYKATFDISVDDNSPSHSSNSTSSDDTKKTDQKKPPPEKKVNPKKKGILGADVKPHSEKSDIKTKKKPKAAAPTTTKHEEVNTPEKTKKVATPPENTEAQMKSKEDHQKEVLPQLEPDKSLKAKPSDYVEDALSIMKKQSPTDISESMQQEGQDDQQKDNRDQDQAAPIVQDIPINSLGIQPVEAPVYTHFNSQIFELFERMVGVITMEKTKGISSTTVKLSMPGSHFNGCEIKIDHYDTAPHSFNIQLIGNPEAVNLFSTNLDDLLAAFKHGKYSFEVNLLTPVLTKDSKHLIKRKASAGSDGDSSDKKDGK